MRLFADAADQLYAAVQHKRRAVLGAKLNAMSWKLPEPLDKEVEATLEDWRKRGQGPPAVGRRRVAVDRDRRGEMARLARHRRPAAARRGAPAGLRRRREARRVHRSPAARHGRVEPRPRGARRDLWRRTRLPEAACARLDRSGADPHVESRIDPARTLFLVSSKSGSTLEPNIFKQYFFARAAAAVGAAEAAKRFVAITDPGSSLEKRARTEGFRHIFHGLPSIGGRYSVLSDFGMVPAAAIGVDPARLSRERGRNGAVLRAERAAGREPGGDPRCRSSASASATGMTR